MEGEKQEERNMMREREREREGEGGKIKERRGGGRDEIKTAKGKQRIGNKSECIIEVSARNNM